MVFKQKMCTKDAVSRVQCFYSFSNIYFQDNSFAYWRSKILSKGILLVHKKLIHLEKVFDLPMYLLVLSSPSCAIPVALSKISLRTMKLICVQNGSSGYRDFPNSYSIYWIGVDTDNTTIPSQGSDFSFILITNTTCFKIPIDTMKNYIIHYTHGG
jgi:hypothetical protein